MPSTKIALKLTGLAWTFVGVAILLVILCDKLLPGGTF